MAESARNPDAERRINEHLEAIDKELAAKGVPLTERRSVTGDVEAQIRDMLAGNAGNTPTAADVETILRKLDAPESYAEDAEAAPVAAASLTAPTEPPRLSRTALIGAAWGALLFVTLAIGLGTSYQGTVAGMPLCLRILTIALLTSYVSAPFGATILGWVAISQIRRSGGRLYGMGMALATSLFYPLLALDAVMAISIWLPVAAIATWFSPNINAHPLKYLFIAFDLVSAAAVCAFVDYRIIRWVWRKVNFAKNGATTVAAG